MTETPEQLNRPEDVGGEDDAPAAVTVRQTRQLIGNTPLMGVEPNERGESSSRRTIYMKMENANPTGSIRDRYLGEILGRAVSAGTLLSGDEVAVAGIDDSSVAAASLASQFELSLRVFVPDGESTRLLPLLRHYGANLEWLEDSSYEEAVEAAAEWARIASDRMFIDGYRPSAVHDAYATIAEEIREGLGGLEPAVFVTSVTTGGAYRQVAGELRESHPNLVVGGALLVDREFESLPEDDRNILRSVSLAKAWDIRDWLASERGLLLGPKGAAAFHLARTLADKTDREGAVVALNPDSGQRYLGWEERELFESPRGLSNSLSTM